MLALVLFFALIFCIIMWSLDNVWLRKTLPSNALREAVRLHGFDSGEFGDVVAVEDLLNMANDIERG